MELHLGSLGLRTALRRLPIGHSAVSRRAVDADVSVAEAVEEVKQAWSSIAPPVGAFAVLLILRAIVNPVNDEVPKGRMPTLQAWLEEKAPRDLPGNYGGRPPPPGGRRSREEVKKLTLESVGSVQELWEMFTFATQQIVEEVPSMLLESNYLLSLVLQLARFPTTFADWEKYESCAVEEISLGGNGTVLGPITDAGELEVSSSREVVLACGEMIDDYGLSLIARDDVSRDIAGMVTLRVKRLPEGCHVEWGDEEDDAASVVCNVRLEDIYAAEGLEAVAYIETVAVDRSWRGSGLADLFLEFVIAKARAWGTRLVALHVHRDNWGALRFYRKRGFEITSDWLGWGEAFFLLLKPI